MRERFVRCKKRIQLINLTGMICIIHYLFVVHCNNCKHELIFNSWKTLMTSWTTFLLFHNKIIFINFIISFIIFYLNLLASSVDSEVFFFTSHMIIKIINLNLEIQFNNKSCSQAKILVCVKDTLKLCC